MSARRRPPYRPSRALRPEDWGYSETHHDAPGTRRAPKRRQYTSEVDDAQHAPATPQPRPESEDA
jgi:hypothetical protein